MNLTRVTPSVDPVITTLCSSHSCIWEKATHKICCILSALPTQVLTLANSSPLILHMCNQVAAQVAMSPVKSLTATAATGPAWPRSCRTKRPLERSHIIAVESLDPDTITLYAGLAARHVTASVWPYRLYFMLRTLFLGSYSQTVTTCEKYKIRVKFEHSFKFSR